jgi:hypothetical protein
MTDVEIKDKGPDTPKNDHGEFYPPAEFAAGLIPIIYKRYAELPDPYVSLLRHNVQYAAQEGGFSLTAIRGLNGTTEEGSLVSHIGISVIFAGKKMRSAVARYYRPGEFALKRPFLTRECSVNQPDDFLGALNRMKPSQQIGIAKALVTLGEMMGIPNEALQPSENLRRKMGQVVVAAAAENQPDTELTEEAAA